jgi:7,8-dihydroneopterin aldolase/epimerase/oxygenase
MLREYTLRLHAVRFRAKLGASHSERALPQEIVVDVELTLPVSAFPKRDVRRDAVDYGTVADIVVEEGGAESYRLLETYAQRLIERLLRETPALRARVSATKLRVPTSHSVDRAVVELVADRDE